MIRSALIYMVSFLICHGIIILPVELEPNVFFPDYIKIYPRIYIYIIMDYPNIIKSWTHYHGG